MTGRKPHDKPSDVDAEDGEVFVDGPDHHAMTLTPEAAEETGYRLIEMASIAWSQRPLNTNDPNADS